MKLKITLLALTMALQTAAFAGGLQANGSAGPCEDNDGPCQTLAQAGVILEPPSKTRWRIPNKVFQRVKAIIASLPFALADRENLLNQTLGDGRTFEEYNSKNKELAESAKAAYLKSLSGILPAEQLKALKVFQASLPNGNTTYLFPEFLRLDEDGMAYSLIHEGVVRKRRPEYVTVALFADQLIFRWMNREPNAKFADFDGFIELAGIIFDDRFESLTWPGFSSSVPSFDVWQRKFYDPIDRSARATFFKLVNMLHPDIPIEELCSIQEERCLHTRARNLDLMLKLGESRVLDETSGFRLGNTNIGRGYHIRRAYEHWKAPNPFTEDSCPEIKKDLRKSLPSGSPFYFLDDAVFKWGFIALEKDCFDGQLVRF